jgi:serine/threonine protein kinase
MVPIQLPALNLAFTLLLVGRLPFEGKDKPEIKRNITANHLMPLPSFLTPQCQSFIRAMLTYAANERPSCAQLLQHPYIAMYCGTQQKPGSTSNVIALHAYSPSTGEADGIQSYAGFFQDSADVLEPATPGANSCTHRILCSACAGDSSGTAGHGGGQLGVDECIIRTWHGVQQHLLSVAPTPASGVLPGCRGR